MKAKLEEKINSMLIIITTILLVLAVVVILFAVNNHDKISFILPFLGAALGSYFTSYLKKAAEINATTHQLREIERQLVVTTTVTEEIKKEIGKESILYQIKQSELTKRKAKAISEIYTSLYKSTSFIKDNRADESDSQEKFKHVITDFWNCFGENNIWLPKDLSVEVSDYFKRVTHQYKRFFQLTMERNEIFSCDYKENLEIEKRKQEEIENILRENLDLIKFITKDSNKILSKIEDRFREITEIP